MPGKKTERKTNYFHKLVELLNQFPKILVVGCDNVGSNHMQRIRTSLRQDATILMGKKTMMRKAIRDHSAQNPKLEALLPHIHGNIGFVFTKKDPAVVRDKLTELKVAAPAKAGTFAPNDVIVPAGNTGLEPTQTSFLQALNIASKINKGQVEIISDVQLLKKGDKVGASEAALLAKLNIKPFLYGLVPRVVYEDGFVFDQKVLDMSDDDILSKIRTGIQHIAGVSLALGIPTLASVPHSLSRGFSNLVGLAMQSSYSFKQADKVVAALKSAPAPSAAPAEEKKGGAPAKGGKDDGAAKKKAEEEAAKKKAEEEKKKAEEEQAEDADMGLDLFG